MESPPAGITFYDVQDGFLFILVDESDLTRQKNACVNYSGCCRITSKRRYLQKFRAALDTGDGLVQAQRGKCTRTQDVAGRLITARGVLKINRVGYQGGAIRVPAGNGVLNCLT
jgi:hypothetical protein